MYKRIHTPNSPLLPLTPLVANMAQASAKMFLSPKDAHRMRRSFTPMQANGKFCSPTSISPIQCNNETHIKNIDGKSIEKSKKVEFSTPPKSLNISFSLTKSANTSMKLLRSSARKANLKPYQPKLTPVRRSLFAIETPSIVEIESSPKTPTTPKVTTSVAVADDSCNNNNNNNNNNSLYDHRDTPRIFLTPAKQHEMLDELKSLTLNEYDGTPNILEQTFTVNSILKEINLRKYSDLFEREEIDLFVFSLLTVDDLVELGIEEQDCDALMAAVQSYREFFGNNEYNNNI